LQEGGEMERKKKKDIRKMENIEANKEDGKIDGNIEE
jgi:hypothetical protein